MRSAAKWKRQVWPSLVFAFVSFCLILWASTQQETMDAYARRGACPTCPPCASVQPQGCAETVQPLRGTQASCPPGRSARVSGDYLICACVMEAP